MKKIAIAVSDFALPVPRKGSIDTHSGYGRGTMNGLEAHQYLQAQRSKTHSSYTAELAITHTFEVDEYAFTVSGRMDGFFASGAGKIEEIKSSFNTYELLRKLQDAQDDHPYCLQAKTYAYIHWLKTAQVPAVSLALISTRDFETTDFDLTLNIEFFEKWLKLRLQELVVEARLAEKKAKRRIKSAAEFSFPFTRPRSGQVELIASIEEGIKEKRPMLIQAPTGLGKTIGVLYPMLKDAMGRGQSVVYVTPKNSQHSVAEDAIERLQATGVSVKGMTLTAKSKLCMQAEPICNPDFCEYAKDHYTKVAKEGLTELLAKKRSRSARTFKKMAEKFQVCPFELQLEAAQDVDVVICDYNYVFAPRSALSTKARLAIDQQGKPNLVIDEAHNLPSRTMDYYSPTLSTFALEKMREDIEHLPKRFRDDAKELLQKCLSVLKSCGPKDCVKPCKIDPPVRAFLEQDSELRLFLANYLRADVEIAPRDVVLRLCFYWSEFTSALEFVSTGRKEFFTTFNPNPATVRITCCDASEMMKDCYDEYEQVVAFSATLKPFQFYERLAGLQEKNLKTAEFVSPFPKEHRKVLIIPQISSKYSEREKSYPRIAEAIEKIAALKKGNYFAFFPSFDFMYRVVDKLQVPAGFQVLVQERSMKRESVDDVLERLRSSSEAHILFAVQGGVFSEGVDYPGDMIIGAFIVGPPLPNFDLEREKMREYYDASYGSGFDYAYTYPAMAKAVQAAGRVIRSETDRGLIVLMDSRFIHPSYEKSMPRDWFSQGPRELVSGRILAEISEFWSSLDASDDHSA